MENSSGTDVKTLYLLRHAKSSWSDSGVADIDRPLAPRGKRAAKAIGSWLRQQAASPAIVLCSSARRARETLALVAPGLGRETPQLVEEGLYAASADELLERLRRLPDRIGSVMLIGHNPGLQDLAVNLAAPGAQLERLRQAFPTAALVIMRIRASSWHGLSPGHADVIDHVVPRDL